MRYFNLLLRTSIKFVQSLAYFFVLIVYGPSWHILSNGSILHAPRVARSFSAPKASSLWLFFEQEDYHRVLSEGHGYGAMSD